MCNAREIVVCSAACLAIFPSKSEIFLYLASFDMETLYNQLFSWCIAIQLAFFILFGCSLLKNTGSTVRVQCQRERESNVFVCLCLSVRVCVCQLSLLFFAATVVKLFFSI